jgi:hypothetical protein
VCAERGHTPSCDVRVAVSGSPFDVLWVDHAPLRRDQVLRSARDIELSAVEET